MDYSGAWRIGNAHHLGVPESEEDVMSTKAMDQAVSEKVKQIMRSGVPQREKYDMLDELYLRVLLNHPDGLAAKVLAEVSAAQTEVLRKGVEI